MYECRVCKKITGKPYEFGESALIKVIRYGVADNKQIRITSKEHWLCGECLPRFDALLDETLRECGVPG